MFLWWCGGVLWWCFCGGVVVFFVFLWLGFCGGVAVFL